MKKNLLLFAGMLTIIILYLLTVFYGGLPGVWHRAQGRVVTYYATVVHDPGACALIRGYWGRAIHEDLRDRCVENYIKNVVQQKSDCQISGLIPDMSHLSTFWLRDEYRYTCLIHHYQSMLGNSLTQKWLPPTCLDMRDKLVVMDYYLKNIHIARANKDTTPLKSPISERDISLIDQCEGFLDTPKIYSFLRNLSPAESESAYIELQKKKTFELK